MNINFKEIWPFVVHRSKKPYDVYIGRPSKWGNPFSTKEGTPKEFKAKDRAEAVEKHKEWVLSQPEMVQMIKKELNGKILACWCSPKLCHGHTLAWIANSDIFNTEHSSDIINNV